jgi:hypothetical protein
MSRLSRGDESQSVRMALNAIIRWTLRRLALGEQARRGDESQSARQAPSAIIRWTFRRLALDEQAFARRVAIGALGTERDHPLDISTPRS